VLTNLELWSEIRRRLRTGAISMRQACSEYHLNFRTIRKIVRQPEPAPLRAPPPRPPPVLGPFLAILQQIVDEERQAPAKQRHTARRISERLRAEHGYSGCSSIVRDAVRAYQQSQAEVFVPLLHPPGEGQVDFGHAAVVVAGVRHKAALFVRTLPHSNARFGCLFPRECTETFPEGHARAFAFFGGVATRRSYDNSTIAVVKLIGRHERHLTREFLRLQAYFAFTAHFCRLRQAHEKGQGENGVGSVRRNFLGPVPRPTRGTIATGNWPPLAGVQASGPLRAATGRRPSCWLRIGPPSCPCRPSPSRSDGSSPSSATRCLWAALTATTTPYQRRSLSSR
jgi:transposase